jgi:Protein of unknown function DUF2620
MSARVGVIGIAGSEVADALRRAGDIEPVVTVDMDAATMLVNGDLSYVIGVCESGGGAALAIPIAIAGAEKCVNLSKLGRPAPPEEIVELLEEGRRVFGVARDHLGQLVPRLAAAILQRENVAPRAS